MLLWLVLILVLAGILTFSIKKLRKADDGPLSIQNELERAVGSHNEQSLAVTTLRNGQLEHFVQGPLSEETTEPEKAVFQIGSVSKVFTVALLQILHDQGRLNFESTLQEVLGDQIPLHPCVQRITLKQLAYHRSGFPRVPKPLLKKIEDRAGKQNVMSDPYSHLYLEDVFAYLEEPVDRSNKVNFKYSNYGMGLLGHVLEHVTGDSLEDLLQREICQPLGMTATGFDPAQFKERYRLQGHDPKGNSTSDWSFSALAGAGGMYSCTEDLMRFLSACLEEEGPMSDSLQSMLVLHPDGQTALGWMKPTVIDRFFGLKDIRWHDGQVGGFAAYVALNPANKTALVLLRNQSLEAYWPGVLMLRKLKKMAGAGY